MDPPRDWRILVIGPSGAGKSTLAGKLASVLAIPVVHLDALFWRPGWVEGPDDEFEEAVKQWAACDRWVMDGNYSRVLAPRLARATTAIWLDLPRRVYVRRAWWRVFTGAGRWREDVGNAERIDWPFLLGWVWDYPSRRPGHEKLMANLPAGVTGITLRTTADVKAFIAGLPGSLEGSRQPH